MEIERFETDELLALARVDFDSKRQDRALYKLKACLSRSDCPAEALALAARVYATLKLFDRAALQ